MIDYTASTYAVISCICWFIVGAAATYAVFSRKIRDTLWERVALSAIGICSIGTAFRVGRQGWITDGFLFISVALAFYVLIIVYKHARGIKCKLPKDKTHPEELEPAWRPDVNL